MKAVIITVGNEILKGRTVNTNTAYIGSFLTHMGYDVVRNLVVKDDPEEIGWAFETALSVSELVVSSGGLGPTFDDLTVSSFAKHFNINYGTDITFQFFSVSASGIDLHIQPGIVVFYAQWVGFYIYFPGILFHKFSYEWCKRTLHDPLQMNGLVIIE